jgi:hypothetical protein
MLDERMSGEVRIEKGPDVFGGQCCSWEAEGGICDEDRVGVVVTLLLHWFGFILLPV